jgi:indole-3-glycerol phosphate synthase
MDTALPPARVIGITSRNLHTFEMVPDRPGTASGAPGVTLVAASGIKTRADIENTQPGHQRSPRRGGERLVTQADLGAALRELLRRAELRFYGHSLPWIWLTNTSDTRRPVAAGSS